jgi:LEA14-like dessication related protein
MLVVVMVAIAGIWLSQQVQQPEALRNVQISLSSAEAQNLGSTSATLVLHLNMHNPNSVTATLDRVNYSLYGNGYYLGDGSISSTTDIPAGQSKTISTTFTLSYSGELTTLWSYLTQGFKVRWRMTGGAHFDTSIGTFDVPFDVTV